MLVHCGSALAVGDTAKSWGQNGFGQLGNGGSSNTSTPGNVSNLNGATAIAAGGNHSLALMSNGTVEAWGVNAGGELGLGNATGPDTCATFACATTPQAVPGLNSVVAIAAGDNHSLALLANGTVDAWGVNNYGQLGDGTTTQRSSPTPVGGLSNVVAIAAGGFHSLALLSNGTVMAWGQNSNGELGNGNNTGPDTCPTFGACAKTPHAVPGVSGVVALSAGLVDSQSLALRFDGTLIAWGLNSNGELGNGNNTGPDTCGSHACSKSPIPITTVSGIASVTAGAGYTIARLWNGQAKAWGYNYPGDLGNGTDTTPSPTPSFVSGLSGATAVAAGDGQALALLSNGALKSWGLNNDGQLGIGSNTGPDACYTTTPCSKTPVAVSSVTGATALALGFAHDLALVGPSQMLRVSLAGYGHGSVGGTEIVCPGSCTHTYAQGANVALLAYPALGTGFAGFSGACTGTGTCRVKMSSDRSVTATFGRPKGTRIKKATVNKKKHRATFRFSARGAITSYQCALVKPKHKPHFSKCRSPKTYKNLKTGTYTFEVRARDILGADPKPAKRKFKI